MNPLLLAHRHTMNNRAELEASRLCACCSCMEVFPAEEVTTYTGLDMSNFDNPDASTANETGVCPRCGVEAVIGDRSRFPLVPEFLKRMNEAWYQKTLIRPPKPKPPKDGSA